MTRYQKLAVTTLVFGYLLVLFGGMVRIAGAEAGCGGDWPGCHGTFLPAWSFPTAIDVTHRALAIIVTGLSVLLVGMSWRQTRDRGVLLALSGSALLLVLLQAGLGALTVLRDLSASVATLHLGLAELFLAALAVLILVAMADRIAPAEREHARRWTSAGILALAAGGMVFTLLMTGAYTSLSSTGLACTDWPLCDGRAIPTGWTPVDIHLTHRWVALAATLLVIALALHLRRARSDSPLLMGIGAAAATLIVAQIFVGAANIWFNLNPIVNTAHLAVATIVWGLVVYVAVLDRMIPVGAPRTQLHPFRQVSRDYFSMTKPGVMSLLLATTLGAMLFAQAGLPPLRILFWTLVGGALASGGAAALNHYLDRDIDEIMARTRNRPVPGGRVIPLQALIFGGTLSVLSVYLMAVFVNTLAALLSLAGNIFYVVIYTMWLKRSTPQNIVIGGAAGAIPPLVGWAAVTGNIGIPAIIMFIVIFAWTPPHFWALALFRAKTRDYAAAGVPQFTNVYGEAATRRQIIYYTVLLVAVSLALVPLGANGPLYLVVAGLLGGLFLHKAITLYRRPEQQPVLARSLFLYSNYYLLLLFTAMVADRLIGI